MSERFQQTAHGQSTSERTEKSNDDRAADPESQNEFWRNPLLHLSLCLGLGALVILAINLADWLK